MSRETGRPPSSYLRTQLPHIIRIALDDGFTERGNVGSRGRHGSAQDYAEAVERTFVALMKQSGKTVAELEEFFGPAFK